MTINKFYTCKYDRPFKEVILSKKNEDLLKWFLEDILKVKVEELEVQTIEMNNGNINVRRKYVDVMLKTNVGKIEIEINACSAPYIHPRNMAFISNIYSNHTLVGQDYSEEVPIIQINFSYGMKDTEKMRVYKMRDESGKEYVKNLIIYEINMEYYKEIWDNKDEEEIEKNKYYIMLDLEEKEIEKISKKDRMVERFMEELKKVNSNPEFQAYMTYEEDQAKIFNSRMKESERIGMEKGMRKGMEKGIKQGLQQGIEQEKIEIAKNMKRDGIHINKIMEYTSLSKEKIDSL
mgnify:CR=1 FL=1